MLKGQIPCDRETEMIELFKILKESPVSLDVNDANLKLNEYEKSESWQRYFPTWLYRWMYDQAAKDSALELQVAKLPSMMKDIPSDAAAFQQDGAFVIAADQPEGSCTTCWRAFRQADHRLSRSRT